MKAYNLNIDTSKPTNQVVQMQQNATGLLSANITNDGKYIRNLSCTMYDGANEIEATTSADNSFGFKVDVGAEPKHVKIEAKSTPIESIKEYIASYTPGHRAAQKSLKILEIPVGTYSQDEFLPLLSQVPPNNPFQVIWSVYTGSANFDRIVFVTTNPDVSKQITFFNTTEDRMLDYDELITVTEKVTVTQIKYVRTSNPHTIVLSSDTYPAIGYYTDYQIDTLVKPSANASYDGEYTEPLKEVEVDGVKFVPTTLSVDGVEYKVLAEVQPAPEPEPEESTSNEGE